MDQKVKDKLTALEADATVAALDWIKERKPHLEESIHAALDRRVDEVVLKLLGFNDRESIEDSWKLDHCNGRSGESAAGDWLRSRAGNAAREWLDAQVGSLPVLSKSAVASLRHEYTSRLETELRRLVCARAIEDARTAVLKICAA